MSKGRDWTLKQKLLQSRIRRGCKEPFKKTEQGMLHYELVRHLVEPSRFEHVLQYEAMMNGMLLQEWITLNTLDGRPNGSEVYVPQGASVACINGDFFDTRVENVVCFINRGERMKWSYCQKENRPYQLPDKDVVYDFCKRWSDEQREKLKALDNQLLH